MIEDKFALEDASFWTDPWASRKSVQGAMMSTGTEGFVIGAPKEVALDRKRTLPLAVLRVKKAQGGSPVDFRATAVLAAWDKNQGRLSARLAFPRPPAAPAPKRPATASGKGDSFSGDDTAMISEASTLDIATRLGLPLEANEFTVALLCLDQVANGCKLKLIESAAYHDAVAEEFLRASREELMGPPRIHPEAGKGRTEYVKQAETPDVPAKPGIALAVQRVTVMRADRPCMLHGSFRLPAKALAPMPRPAGEEAPTAIVPIGLLLTGSVHAEPVVLNISVPSYTPLEKIGGGTFATGFFALDLCAFAKLGGTVQTWFIYGFSGDCVAGPTLAAFVNPVLTWATRDQLEREAVPVP